MTPLPHRRRTIDFDQLRQQVERLRTGQRLAVRVVTREEGSTVGEAALGFAQNVGRHLSVVQRGTTLVIRAGTRRRR